MNWGLSFNCQHESTYTCFLCLAAFLTRCLTCGTFFARNLKMWNISAQDKLVWGVLIRGESLSSLSVDGFIFSANTGKLNATLGCFLFLFLAPRALVFGKRVPCLKQVSESCLATLGPTVCVVHMHLYSTLRIKIKCERADQVLLTHTVLPDKCGLTPSITQPLYSLW